MTPSGSSRAAPSVAAVAHLAAGAEVTEGHTKLLRVSLLLDESRSYWEHRRPEIAYHGLHNEAFEKRWFGSKTMARVRVLIRSLELRFAAFPTAMKVLRDWRPTDLTTRQLICHWHTQLTDPIYRALTGSFLEARRALPERTVDRDLVVRWARELTDDKWASATTQRMANGLLSTASEAGLCSTNPGKREVKFPNVPDAALSYLFYLLRSVRIEGSLLQNPYVASVALTEGFLEERLRRLGSVSFGRMADVHEFDWAYPDLSAWAAGEGHVRMEAR